MLAARRAARRRVARPLVAEGPDAEQPPDVAQVPPAAQVRDVPPAAHPAASLSLKLSPGPQRGLESLRFASLIAT